MGFLDFVKKQEVQIEEKPTIQSTNTAGKGKKQCLQCENYVGVRKKICDCGFDFETKTLSLFASTNEQKSLIQKLKITNENLIQWILMCSYTYYCRHESILPDEEYDKLFVLLKNNWKILEHRHKYLIKEESLENGSLFYLSENDYPQIIQHSALRFIKAMKKYKASIDVVVEKKLYNLVAFNELVY
jgi:hypothetical protein